MPNGGAHGAGKSGPPGSLKNWERWQEGRPCRRKVNAIFVKSSGASQRIAVRVREKQRQRRREWRQLYRHLPQLSGGCLVVLTGKGSRNIPIFG